MVAFTCWLLLGDLLFVVLDWTNSVDLVVASICVLWLVVLDCGFDLVANLGGLLFIEVS